MGIGQLFSGLNFSWGRDKDAKEAQRYPARVQLERIKLDIDAWRDSIKEAESAYFPHRVKMQRIFLDTVLNDHVFSCMNRRKNLTLLKEFVICDSAGNEDEVLSNIFRKQWFNEFLGYVLDANFYGYSLIALGDVVNDEFPNLQLLKRHHISPDRYQYAPFVYSLSGWNFMDPSDKDDEGNSLYDWSVWVPTLTESGISNCGYGLLYRVAKCEIFLRKNITWNADFIEMFGHPTRHAKTTKLSGDDGYDALEQALATAGAKHYLITDPTDEIDMIQPTSVGKGMDIYGTFEERLEKKISKLILGHGDAMDSTPGKLGGQGKDDDSVGKAMKEVEAIDNVFAQHVVNTSLIPKMRALGFKIPESYRFEFKNNNEAEEIRQAEDASNAVTAGIVKTLKDAGLKVDPKYITERTGIPVEIIEEPEPEPMVNNPNIPKHVSKAINKLYGVK